MPAIRRPADRDDAHVPVPRLPVRHHHRRRDQRPSDQGAARLRGAGGRRQHSDPGLSGGNVDGEHGAHAEGRGDRAVPRAGADARVRVLLRRRVPRPDATQRAGRRRRPARGCGRSSTACPATRSTRARPRPAPMRCRRSTIARSTAPTRRPRTACSSPRRPTARPPSRWKRRSTGSPLRSAGRPSASPTSSRCRARIRTAPRRSTR